MPRGWFEPVNLTTWKLTKAEGRIIDWNLVGKGSHLIGDEEAIKAQWALVKEEWSGKDECLDSYNNHDLVGFIDGLCDTFVTVCYAYYLNKGERANFKKISPITEEEFEEYLDCSYEDLTPRCVAAMLISLNVDWSGALNNVLSSNESKYDIYSPRSEGEYTKYCQVIMDQGRYKDVRWKVNMGKVVYYEEGTNKILKGRDFFNPKLEEFIL